MAEPVSTAVTAARIAAQAAIQSWNNRDRLVQWFVFGLIGFFVFMAIIVSVPGLIFSSISTAAGVPAELMEYYQGAQVKYNVPWYYLAAINKIETNFGTGMGSYRVLDVLPAEDVSTFNTICSEANRDPGTTLGSASGAIGWMQFMPGTWMGYREASETPPYDPWDPQDAIYATAKLLHDNGFDTDPRAAIRRYNFSDEYVDSVVNLAETYRLAEEAGGLIGSSPFPANAEGYVFPTGAVFYVYTDLFGAPRDYGAHSGIDIAVPEGSPLYAIYDGTIILAGDTGIGGYTVKILGDDGRTYTYCHLNNYGEGVIEGARVFAGQVIGDVGMTGRTTGPHLHFGIQDGGVYVDPQPILSAIESASR